MERLARLQQAAQAKGGQCLESTYLGADVSHRFACAQGHHWKARPSKIFAKSNASWCRKCAHAEHAQRMRRQDGLALLQRIATEKGGICLSNAYTTGNAYYGFRCAQGHQWETVGNEVVRGAWCRLCANATKKQSYLLADGLERLQKCAQNKGGECLSQVYLGAKAHYRFRCRDGHEWESTGHRIIRGGWCPPCAHGNKRLGIALMRHIAYERGGACLSEHYQNSWTKLHWECHRGHRWHARPSSIKKGHWCPECSHLEQIRSRKSNARWKYLAQLGNHSPSPERASRESTKRTVQDRNMALS